MQIKYWANTATQFRFVYCYVRNIYYFCFNMFVIVRDEFAMSVTQYISIPFNVYIITLGKHEDTIFHASQCNMSTKQLFSTYFYLASVLQRWERNESMSHYHEPTHNLHHTLFELNANNMQICTNCTTILETVFKN